MRKGVKSNKNKTNRHKMIRGCYLHQITKRGLPYDKDDTGKRENTQDSGDIGNVGRSGVACRVGEAGGDGFHVVFARLIDRAVYPAVRVEAVGDDRAGGLVVLVGGGAAYYFKIYRPKQEQADSSEDFDEYEPDDSDPYGEETEDDSHPWYEDEDENSGDGDE